MRPISAISARHDDPAPSSRNRRAAARPMPLFPRRSGRCGRRAGRDVALSRTLRLRRMRSDRWARRVSQSLTWKIASISTAIPPGSATHADGAPRADARIAEDVFHQVGVAVDHLGLIVEFRSRS